MNFKNLVMWAIIVLLSVGLFNMFQDPNRIASEKNNISKTESASQICFDLFEFVITDL